MFQTHAAEGIAAGTGSVSQYLAFTLDEEEYGVDIKKVQELRGYEAVTRIANAPDFIKGVVNLRGVIVPIIDMRIQLKLGTPTYNEFTVVIVLNFGRRIIGMVVDSVSDVISLGAEHIKPAPQTSALVENSYLTGIATVDQRMVMLLDIDKLMASRELGLIDAPACDSNPSHPEI